MILRKGNGYLSRFRKYCTPQNITIRGVWRHSLETAEVTRIEWQPSLTWNRKSGRYKLFPQFQFSCHVMCVTGLFFAGKRLCKFEGSPKLVFFVDEPAWQIPITHFTASFALRIRASYFYYGSVKRSPVFSSPSPTDLPNYSPD